MVENIIYIVIGMIASQLFKYVMSLGSSVMVLRQTQRSCAALFVISAKGLEQILELKYIEMADAKRSEQNIVAQRHIDQMNIDTIKSTIMRNFVNQFPSSYKHILEYTTWREMEDFVIKETYKGVSE